MIKLVYALRRRADIDRVAFQHYWLATHGPLVRDAAATLAVVRYVQSHTIVTPIDAALAGARGCAAAPYDGVAELWWDSEATLLAAMGSENGQKAAAVLLADEADFIDFATSAIFFTHEEIIVGAEVIAA